MSGHAYSAVAVRAQSLRERERSSGPALALGVAALCVIGLAMVWSVAELVPSAQYRDAVLLHDFTLLSRPRLDNIGETLLRALAPLPFIIWGVALMAIAFARERGRVALAVAGVMGLAPLSAEILKPLLAHSHLALDGMQVGPASWPSGHSTAALALALSALLVTPRRLRPLVAAIGALFALTVGCFLLILSWHMPSDVLGGYLMATLWAALAVAALRAAERRWPTGRPL
jgi:membrane-associated phospholipid phosphatase